MTSDTAFSHCLFLYFFVARRGVVPVVPKDFITYACSKTRRVPIAETSLVQYARRFHNAQVYISRQTRKAPLRPRETVIAWEGGWYFSTGLYYIHRCIPHRTGMSLLALSSIFVAPYRSRLRRLKSWDRVRAGSLLPAAKLSGGICRVSAGKEKGEKGGKKGQRRATLIPEGIRAEIRVNQSDLVF